MHSYPSKEDVFPTELKKLRRMFHKNPEIGFAEFWTTARICEYVSQLNCDLLYGTELYDNFPEPELLKKWDNELHESAKEHYKEDEWIAKLNGRTGLVAIIKGKQPGPNVCFRFDIDGLPIEESNEASHIPFMEGFNSTNKNMHACGHDGHIAIGLGLAKKISENSEALNGTYFILFQPAEEVISGGKIFSKLSFIKEVNYFIPVHIGLIGEKKVVCGVSFLADKRYKVLFKGRSSHAGASPEKGKNALAAACSAVTGLYGISRHSAGCSRINIGEFISKNASNIISDKAQFELDLRGETEEICEYLRLQAQNIIGGASIMYGVEHEIRFVAEAETAVNSAELIAQVRKVCLEAGLEEDDIIDNYLVPGSEDATFIMNAVIKNGGLSTYIGFGSPTFGGHHNEKFDFDEEVLFQGVKVLHKIVEKISKEHI
jgi:aminobenzoyl-glutamate utilization protein A